MEKKKDDLFILSKNLFIDVSNEIIGGFKEIVRNLFYGFKKHVK